MDCHDNSAYNYGIMSNHPNRIVSQMEERDPSSNPIPRYSHRLRMHEILLALIGQ